MPASQGNAKARYTRLATDRTQFLQRARHNALLTIPSLMPLEGQTKQAHLVEPYQGIGSRGVVHLSSRITVGLLPAGRPYMRFELPPAVKMQSGGEVDIATQKGLALAEQLVQTEVEAKNWRQATLMSVQQLMVAGNVVEYMQPDNAIKVFRLDQFVVLRDHLGRISELIIEEKFARDAAPAEFGVADTGRDDVELYTYIKLSGKGQRRFYRRHQELGDGTKIGKSTTWAIEDLPYLALRWSATPGEDYGRSKIEEHIADLRSLDALEKAQLEMAGMASRNFIMVAPGAGASGIKNRLTRAVNGDTIVGDPSSVELKSFDNAAGFQITAAQVQTLRESLASAFLLLSGSQRKGERVTATEIERDIQELEGSLGGTFTVLSQEMMEARTRILVTAMIDQQKLPPIKEVTVPVILTGLEALSRERDVGRAGQAAELVQMFGEGAMDVVKIDKILGRAFVGLGYPDAVRDENEAAQFRQARQEQQAQTEAIAKSAPGVAREVAKGAVQQEAG